MSNRETTLAGLPRFLSPDAEEGAPVLLELDFVPESAVALRVEPLVDGEDRGLFVLDVAELGRSAADAELGMLLSLR